MTVLEIQLFQGQRLSQHFTIPYASLENPEADASGTSGPIAQLEEPPAHNR